MNKICVEGGTSMKRRNHKVRKTLMSAFLISVLFAESVSAAGATYPVTRGNGDAYYKGSANGFSLSIAAPVSEFIDISIDQNVLSQNDYTVSGTDGYNSNSGTQTSSAPAVSETPEPSETPTTSEAPEPSETPTTSEAPEPSETPATSEAPDTTEAPWDPTTEVPYTTEAPWDPTTEAPYTTEAPDTTEAPWDPTTEVPYTTEAPDTTEAPWNPTTEAPYTTEAPDTTEAPWDPTTETPYTTAAPYTTAVPIEPWEPSESDYPRTEEPAPTMGTYESLDSDSGSLFGQLLSMFGADEVQAASGAVTNITVKSSYMDQLSAGKHEITVEFENGSASAVVYVENAKTAGGQSVSGAVQTGDSTPWALYGIMAVLSLAVIFVLGRKSYTQK